MRISDWSSDVCSSDLSPVSCAPSKCGGKIDMASSHTDIIVDQVLELDPATIDVSGRVGLFFPEKAEAYAALIARDGQRTPITVRRNGTRAKLPWTLVAGLPRHRGGRKRVVAAKSG